MRALLIGEAPPLQGYEYVAQPPYEAVVLGSLTLSMLLCFSVEEALQALSEGKTVVLYTPGLPPMPKNRALAASVASRKRELKNWGVVFTDGMQKRLITAKEAQRMHDAGELPAVGAVLTPLAREILEGKGSR